MTAVERKLRSVLRYKQLNGHLFYRQKPVGGYIVNSYCPKAKPIIEVDSGRYFTDEGKEYDRVRDESLENIGLHILVVPNHNVLTNVYGVVEYILGVEFANTDSGE